MAKGTGETTREKPTGETRENPDTHVLSCAIEEMGV